jgi:hypothetical protein
MLHCPDLLNKIGVLTENLIYLMQHTQQGCPNIRLISCCSFMDKIFSPEDGDSMFLQNVGIYQQVYMTPKPRTSSFSPP